MARGGGVDGRPGDGGGMGNRKGWKIEEKQSIAWQRHYEIRDSGRPCGYIGGWGVGWEEYSYDDEGKESDGCAMGWFIGGDADALSNIHELSLSKCLLNSFAGWRTGGRHARRRGEGIHTISPPLAQSTKIPSPFPLNQNEKQIDQHHPFIRIEFYRVRLKRIFRAAILYPNKQNRNIWQITYMIHTHRWEPRLTELPLSLVNTIRMLTTHQFTFKFFLRQLSFICAVWWLDRCSFTPHSTAMGYNCSTGVQRMWVAWLLPSLLRARVRVANESGLRAQGTGKWMEHIHVY